MHLGSLSMVVDNLPLVQTPPRKNRAPVRPYAVSMLACALAIVANPALAQDVEPTGGDPSEPPVPVPPADADLPELGHVITDEEFEDTIPELDPSSDPELDAPLEESSPALRYPARACRSSRDTVQFLYATQSPRAKWRRVC